MLVCSEEDITGGYVLKHLMVICAVSVAMILASYAENAARWAFVGMIAVGMCCTLRCMAKLVRRGDRVSTLRDGTMDTSDDVIAMRSREILSSLPPRVVGAADMVEMCPMCLEEMAVGAEVIELPCSHRFHASCSMQWLTVKLACPVCRAVPACGGGDKEPSVP
jgi:hypothetical protein